MKRPHKFGAVRTIVDGKSFASKREARRYQELELLQRAGKIQNLATQISYPLKVNGVLICRYIADFKYLDLDTGANVVEDSKGYATPEYKLKKKLMKAVHEIDIREV